MMCTPVIERFADHDGRDESEPTTTTTGKGKGEGGSKGAGPNANAGAGADAARANRTRHPCECTGMPDIDGKGWRCSRWGSESALEPPWCYVQQSCPRARPLADLLYRPPAGRPNLFVADCLTEELAERDTARCPFAAMSTGTSTATTWKGTPCTGCKLGSEGVCQDTSGVCRAFGPGSGSCPATFAGCGPTTATTIRTKGLPDRPVFDCRVGVDDRTAFVKGKVVSGLGHTSTVGEVELRDNGLRKFLPGSLDRIVDADTYMCQQVLPGLSRNTFLRTPGTRRGPRRVQRKRTRRASIASFDFSGQPPNPVFESLEFTVDGFDADSRPVLGRQLCKGFYLPEGGCVSGCPDTAPFVDRFRRCRPPGAKQVEVEAVAPRIRGLVGSLTPELVFTFPWHASEAWVYVTPRAPRRLFQLRFFGGGAPELQPTEAEKAYAKANGPVYIKHTVGTCQGTGHEFIETASECTAAGAELGVTTRPADESFADSNTRPHGCYTRFSGLFFNAYGVRDGTDLGRVSLCCQGCIGDTPQAPVDARAGKTHRGVADLGSAAFRLLFSQAPVSSRFADIEASDLLATCHAECVARRPIRDVVWSSSVAHSLEEHTFDAYLGECTGVEFRVLPEPVPYVAATTLAFAGIEIQLDHPLQPVAGVAKAGRLTGLALTQPAGVNININTTAGFTGDLVYVAPDDGGCKIENYDGAGDLTGKIVVVEDGSDKRVCPIYTLSAAGGCTGAGRSLVETAEECDTAAHCLRLPPTKVERTVSEASSPAGCYFEPARMDIIGRKSLFFNTAGSPSSSTGSKLAVCRTERLASSCDDGTRIRHAAAKGAAAVIIALNNPHQVYIGEDGYPFSNNPHGSEYNRNYEWEAKARKEWLHLRYIGQPNAAATSEPDPYGAQVECTAPLRLTHVQVAADKRCTYREDLGKHSSVAACKTAATTRAECFSGGYFDYQALGGTCGCHTARRFGSTVADQECGSKRTAPGFTIYKMACELPPVPSFRVPPQIGSDLYLAAAVAAGRVDTGSSGLVASHRCALTYKQDTAKGLCSATRAFERCMQALCEDFHEILAAATDPELLSLWEFVGTDRWHNSNFCVTAKCTREGTNLPAFLDLPGVTLPQRGLELARARLRAKDIFCPAAASDSPQGRNRTAYRSRCPAVNLAKVFTSIRKQGIADFAKPKPKQDATGPAPPKWTTFAQGSSCIKHGCVPLVSEAKCRAAAADLRLLSPGEQVQFRKVRDQSPLGCYWNPNDHDNDNDVFYFNPTDPRCTGPDAALFCSPSVNPSPCTHRKQCICDCSQQLLTCERSATRTAEAPVRYTGALGCSARFPYVTACKVAIQ